MRISEGNIFEAMRLVLPEHRDKMAQFERESHKTRLPVLAPDKLREMHHTLEIALQEGQEVQVTLFNPHKNQQLAGIPFLKGGKLFIACGNETHALAFEQIVHIEEI